VVSKATVRFVDDLRIGLEYVAVTLDDGSCGLAYTLRDEGGEGGASCGGVVPASRIHRDQPDPAEPGGGAVLQQTRYGRTVDQGGQASGVEDPPWREDDASRLAGCHRFRSNELRLWLSVIAYNLGNPSVHGRLVLPKRIDNWSLTSLQPVSRRAGEAGRSAGPALRDARYYWLLLAESVA
jgi:hypothetical protein